MLGHKYLVIISVKTAFYSAMRIAFGADTFPTLNGTPSGSDFTEVYGIITPSDNKKILGILGDFTSSSATRSFSVNSFMVFELTQMFGSGYEPTTLSQFREMYPNFYYEYTLTQMQRSKNNY